MKCMVYISQETRRLQRADILDILRTSRINNSVRGVTGVLLYYDGLFLQVLEGEDVVMESLMQVLRHDRRHQDIRVLLDETVETRHFSDWSMGLVDMADLPAEDRWLCRNLKGPPPTLHAGALTDRIRRLIGSFQAMVGDIPDGNRG